MMFALDAHDSGFAGLQGQGGVGEQGVAVGSQRHGGRGHPAKGARGIGVSFDSSVH